MRDSRSSREDLLVFIGSQLGVSWFAIPVVSPPPETRNTPTALVAGPSGGVEIARRETHETRMNTGESARNRFALAFAASKTVDLYRRAPSAVSVGRVAFSPLLPDEHHQASFAACRPRHGTRRRRRDGGHLRDRLQC